MGYTKWVLRIVYLILAFILTISGKLIFMPVLLSQAHTKDIHDYEQVTQSNLNPYFLLERGKRLYHANKFAEAISVLKQAEQIFKGQDSSIKQGIALSNIALAYKQIGKYPQALNYITQSRNLIESKVPINEQEKLSLLAQILDIQANLQLTLGKPLAALDNWKQATIFYQRTRSEEGENRSLINQNLALQALGRYHQSRKILEKLIPKLEKQPVSVMKILALQSLGDVQLYLGETESSLKTLENTYKIAHKIKSNSRISETLLSLANVQYVKGKKILSRSQNTVNFAQTTPLVYSNIEIPPQVKELYKKSVETYYKALKISTSPTNIVKAKLNLLTLLIELQEFPQARELYLQIESLIKELPVSQISIHARIQLAQSLLHLKQVSLSDALNWKNITQILAVAIKQAELLEDVRSQTYGMGVLASVYLQTQNFNYAQQLSEKAVNLALEIDAKDIAYLWQWQLGYIFKVQNNITEAINYYSQAVHNLNDLRSDLLTLNPDIQFSFRDGVEPVYRQLVDLLLQSTSSGNINQVNLKKARDVIEALQLREIENYFQEACLQAKPEIIDTVVDKTDNKAAVIYPIILQNRLEIILKLPNQPQFNHYTTFIKANIVENTLDQLQYSLRQPEQINQIKKISGEVYSWLIQPLEADLQKHKIETLVFVLDGNFRNIPIGVLYDNQSQEKKYLIEKYAVALTPGLQMLEPKPLLKGELNALIAGISKKRFIENKDFNALKNVQLEVKKVSSQITKAKSLLNQDFTDIALEKQINSAKYTVVHIATHSNFSSNLEQTYILTWNKLLKVKDFDRLFPVHENRDSQPIQLLVLSSCETANGDKRATLGLSGIAIRAGARSTLATLWAVEDKSTAEFMGKFYEELQQNNLNKAKALQQAQIHLLHKKELPFIWAPYVLVGNWL